METNCRKKELNNFGSSVNLRCNSSLQFSEALWLCFCSNMTSRSLLLTNWLAVVRLIAFLRIVQGFSCQSEVADSTSVRRCIMVLIDWWQYRSLSDHWITGESEVSVHLGWLDDLPGVPTNNWFIRCKMFCCTTSSILAFRSSGTCFQKLS